MVLGGGTSRTSTVALPEPARRIRAPALHRRAHRHRTPGPGSADQTGTRRCHRIRLPNHDQETDPHLRAHLLLAELLRELQEEAGVLVDRGDAAIVGCTRDAARAGKPDIHALVLLDADPSTLTAGSDRTELHPLGPFRHPEEAAAALRSIPGGAVNIEIWTDLLEDPGNENLHRLWYRAS